jgi:hypothetical protein
MDEFRDMDSAEKAASPHGSVVAENENILTAKYQYSPLKTPTSIRLLVIEKDGNHGHVRFSLEEADLNDSPQYEALSHRWKSEDGSSETVSLKIDNIDNVSITQNLHDFLQCLIHIMLEKPVRRTMGRPGLLIYQLVYRGSCILTPDKLNRRLSRRLFSYTRATIPPYKGYYSAYLGYTYVF